MVPGEIEQIGGRDLNQVCEHRLAADTRLRRRDGGFQERAIAYTIEPAESCDGLGVYLLDDSDSEVNAIVWSNAHESFFIVRA